MAEDVATPGSHLWKVVGRVGEKVSIYDGPEVFHREFATVKPEAGLLFAAHWCQAEVCNGGFKQFYYNSTGILAPEAVAGFRTVGLPDASEVVADSMRLFGSTYPRERLERQALLERLATSIKDGKRLFEEFDDRFYDCLDAEPERWEHAADKYVIKHHLE